MKRSLKWSLPSLILIAGLALLVSCGSGESDTAKVKKENNQSQSKVEQQLWTCGMHPEVILDHPGQCPKCGMDLVPLKTAPASSGLTGNQNKQQDKDAEKELWTCGMHPEVILDHPGQCPKCGMDLVPLKKQSPAQKENKPQGKGKILYWQAPMVPTEIYDHPGKSKMGMDLVPVYENQTSAGSTVIIDPVTMQNMNVRVSEVQRKTFVQSIRTVGLVKYNEQTMRTVSSKISGWIEKLYIDFTGQAVRRGQALLEIYSPELVSTQQEYLLALKSRDQAANSTFENIRQGGASLLAASRQRLAYWDIPPKEVRRLEQTRQVRRTMRIESPFNGVVIKKQAEEGLYVTKGMTLYQMADLSTVWIEASVYEDDARLIRTGLPAVVHLPFDGASELNGTVTFIYPYLDQKARDFKVRMAFDNSGLKLKPGMYVDVFLKTPPAENAVVVPSEAVIRSGKRNIVLVARGDGRFTPRQVRIAGENEAGEIHILAGVQPGEQVVTSAQFLIDSESRLQEAIQKMLAERSKK